MLTVYHDYESDLFGVITVTYADTDRLVSFLVRQCPGVTFRQTDTSLQVTVSTPHRLTNSAFFAGAVALTQTSNRDERYQIIRHTHSSLKRNHRHHLTYPLAMGAELVRFTPGNMTLGHDGVTLELGHLSPPQRILALGELYGAMRPEAFPLLGWRGENPGGSAVAGYPCRAIGRDELDRMKALAAWLAPAGIPPRFGGSTRRYAEVVMTDLPAINDMLLNLFRRLGEDVQLDQDSGRMVFPGTVIDVYDQLRQELIPLLLDHGDQIITPSEDGRRVTVDLKAASAISQKADAAGHCGDPVPYLATELMIGAYRLLRPDDLPRLQNMMFPPNPHVTLLWDKTPLKSIAHMERFLAECKEITGCERGELL